MEPEEKAPTLTTIGTGVVLQGNSKRLVSRCLHVANWCSSHGNYSNRRRMP